MRLKLTKPLLLDLAGRTEVLKVPQGFNLQDWELIGFLQNAKTGEVIAASRADLSAATTLSANYTVAGNKIL